MTNSLLLKMNHRNSWFTYKRWWFSLLPEANGNQQELSQHGRLSQFPPSVEPWMVFHFETWSSPGRPQIGAVSGVLKSRNMMEYMGMSWNICIIYIYVYIFIWEYVGTYGKIREISWNIVGNIMEYMGHIMEYSGNTIHVNERKKNMEWMGRQWQPLNEQIVFFREFFHGSMQ